MNEHLSFVLLNALLILVILEFEAAAQTAQVEAMTGDKNYLFQSTYSGRFDKSSFGYFNTSSLYFYYDDKRKTEVMSQSYITYKARPWLTIAAGTFFATAPGFKTSFAIQISKKYRDFFILIVPRIDFWKNPNAEVMTFAEYRPALTGKFRLYSRIQVMLNQNRIHHNRSYENFRIGVQSGKAQIGFAFNRDYYGSERLSANNTGLFVRYEFN